MARKLDVIDKAQGHTSFRVFMANDKVVRCAFLERCCSPDCAGCRKLVLYEKHEIYKCDRGDFEIGTKAVQS